MFKSTQSFIPTVIEKTSSGERYLDLYSRLLRDRVIFVIGEITDSSADAIVGQLLLLEAGSPDEEIYMYINSPGGSVTAMFAIFDVMNYVKSEIVTIGYGHCMSAGSFLLAAGKKGRRCVLPNVQIMLHELSTGNQGKFNDIKVDFEHTQKLYNKMSEYYVDFTGQKLSKIKRCMHRDFYMTSEEAVKFGLVDKIYDKR